MHHPQHPHERQPQPHAPLVAATYEPVLRAALGHALTHLHAQHGTPATLPVRPTGKDDEVRTLLGGELPDAATDATTVLETLVRGAAPGLVRSGGGRYFGYVTGGTLPVAMAADWLTSTWDQNTIVHDGSPATAVAEEICAKWLVDLLGLTPGTSVAFTPSTTFAELLGLTVARHRVLADQGWQVPEKGLHGALRSRSSSTTPFTLPSYAACRPWGWPAGSPWWRPTRTAASTPPHSPPPSAGHQQAP